MTSNLDFCKEYTHTHTHNLTKPFLCCVWQGVQVRPRLQSRVRGLRRIYISTNTRNTRNTRTLNCNLEFCEEYIYVQTHTLPHTYAHMRPPRDKPLSVCGYDATNPKDIHNCARTHTHTHTHTTQQFFVYACIRLDGQSINMARPPGMRRRYLQSRAAP